MLISFSCPRHEDESESQEATLQVAAPNPPAPAVEALESIYREHVSRVIRAAYRITGNMAEAEDVAQGVFLRLMAVGDRSRIENLGAYLHRAAVNGALDVVRARAASVPLDLDSAAAEPLRPFLVEDASRDAELRQWLRLALGRLHPRTAEMFVLRYIEEFDNAEIAQRLGTSRATVAVTLFRARTFLRKDFRARSKERKKG